MPGQAGSAADQLPETPLAPGDGAWSQPGEAESFPCIQVFPEAGLSLVLGGVERGRCEVELHSVLGKELLAGGRTCKYLFASHPMGQ